MLNKKGLQEEGMHFSTGQILGLLLFVVLVALAFILIVPKLSTTATQSTLYNFGAGIFETLTGG